MADHLRSDSVSGGDFGSNRIDAPPKHWSRVFIIACLSVLLFIGAIVGAYALVLHETDVQNQARARATAERNAQLKLASEKQAILGAVPLCRGLVLMDQADNGAVNASSSPNSYGHRLAAAIHVVVENSKCYTLLGDLAKHKPFQDIAKQIGETVR
jgi:hypothetical protein